jgi:ABC-type antimicrobial peptide transport system permease subunit
VVGLVKDIRSENIRRPARRLFYVPQLQTRDELSSTRFIIRTRVDPKLLFLTLRNAVRTESPALPVLSIDTADDLLVRTLDRDRLIAALSIGFGILALVLAGVGTYGLLSYEVTRRTGEVGIRMALGATRTDIVMLMLGEVAAIAAAGVVGGIAGAVASGRIVTTLVFGLEPNDPRVLACAAVILLGVALCAGFLPARRAARMEPAAALRHE